MTVPLQDVQPAMISGMHNSTYCYPDSRLGDAGVPHAVDKKGQQSQNDSGEPIVVGAVSSAAPWFLMGWAEGMEVKFIIDAGCQMTILATSVFDRMCVSDPRMSS